MHEMYIVSIRIIAYGIATIGVHKIPSCMHMGMSRSTQIIHQASRAPLTHIHTHNDMHTHIQTQVENVTLSAWANSINYYL